MGPPISPVPAPKKRQRSRKRTNTVGNDVKDDKPTPSVPSTAVPNDENDKKEEKAFDSLSVATSGTPISIFTPSGRKSRSKAAREQIAMIEATGEKVRDAPRTKRRRSEKERDRDDTPGKRNSTSTATGRSKTNSSRISGKKAATLAVLASATTGLQNLEKENIKENKTETPRRRAGVATSPATKRGKGDATPKNKTENVVKTPSRKKSTVIIDFPKDEKKKQDDKKEDDKKKENEDSIKKEDMKVEVKQEIKEEVKQEIKEEVKNEEDQTAQPIIKVEETVGENMPKGEKSEIISGGEIKDIPVLVNFPFLK